LLFSRINVKEAWKFFREINQSLFFLAIGISIFGNVYLSGQKYRRLLQLLKCDISLGEAILIKLGTIPLKHILPLKSGEVMRALYLKQRHNLSYVKGGCSILMGMGLSLISLLVIVLLTGFFYNYDLKQRYYFGVPILGGLVVGAMAFRKGVLPQATHTWLESTNGKIAAVVKDITEVSKGEHYKRRLIALLGYSIGFEGAKLVCCLLIFIASGIVIPPEPVLFYTPMVLMISSLPITVFGLGTMISLLPFGLAIGGILTLVRKKFGEKAEHMIQCII
jgi:uncharacterized membrane protein YbhN (UPF0104 family)